MKEQNFSRRAFLLSSATSFAATLNWLESPLAWGAKKKKVPTTAGPKPLSRQDWPLAIVPDHLGVDRGYCCFTDEFGRLAVVDMRKPGDPRTPATVVAELNGLGHKVIDFKVVMGRGFGLVSRGSDSGDTQLVLVCINLTPMTEPVISASLVLDKFVDVSCLSANGSYVCVAGTSLNSENMVAIFSAQRHGKDSELSLIGNWTAAFPVIALDLQERNLAVLEQSNFEYVSLVDPRTPQTRGSVKLDGDFKALSRIKDLAMVIGTANGESAEGKSEAKASAQPDTKQAPFCQAVSIALESTPRVVSQVPLHSFTSVLDCTVTKDRFLLLGEVGSDRALMSVSFDKAHQIHAGEISQLPKQNIGYGSHSSIVASNKNAYIASGWAGIEVVANTGTTWTSIYNYSIPRLPAFGIASWGNRAVIAGSDLKLYDIGEPGRPTLMSTSNVSNPLRSMVGAGSYVLCLTRDSVNLRKMDSLDTPVGACKLVGVQICYDSAQKKGYVLSEQAKKTTITKLKVYSNEVAPESTFEVPGKFSKASALNGSIALAGLNDISLYTVGTTADLIAVRHFENLAIRDICLREDDIVACAVDQNSKGFLLILSRDQKICA